MTPTHLRLISFLEGVSFIVLLLIAYVLDMRQFVRYAGMAHGALFLLFLIALIIVCHRQKWGIGTLIFGLIAGFLPFMPFVFERYVAKKVENEEEWEE